MPWARITKSWPCNLFSDQLKLTGKYHDEDDIRVLDALRQYLDAMDPW